MKQERITWAGGINRSLDPRHIQNHEQYDACDVEVVRSGILSKRKGFGRWRGDINDVIGGAARGAAVFYDSDGNRYLFVFYDSGGDIDVWIEKDDVKLANLANFFPTSGHRVRSAVFGDRIYFVNGVDRPRWYKEYDGAAHVWGIAGVPSPARRAEDESSFDYFISRASYADCITSSSNLGIDPPGIWRYKQAIGYYGKQSDQQVEESNAGPASRMFHCQFNTAEALGVVLEGYIRKGIELGVADFDDLILDVNETGGQDYEDVIRWMRMYRQHKMFSDELYSPFEFLVEMKKGWPTSIADVYSRDSAVVAPTTRVSIPVSHHIENANNRLFLGRVEKELFTQPGLPNNFRTFVSGYKANFSYRMPVTVHNTNSKTLTGAVIPLRFQHSSSAYHVATPPSGGGVWVGAYIDTTLNLNGTTTGWYQMMFVDNDGVTPLGFAMIAKGTNVVTFLVEIPEIAAGGSRTIYLYFEDSQLAGGGNPEDYPGEPGDWESLAHYPLLSSDHWMLADFLNWKSSLGIEEVTQKRSLGKIDNSVWGLAAGGSRQTFNTMFFNKALWTINSVPVLRVLSQDATETAAAVRFYPPVDSSSSFSICFLANTRVGEAAGHSYVDITKDDGTLCARFAFTQNGVNAYLDVTVYETGGTPLGALQLNSPLGTGGIGCNGDWLYYFLTIDGSKMWIGCIYGNGTAHPAEGSQWTSVGKYITWWVSRNDLAKAIELDSSGMYFGARVVGTATPSSSSVVFSEMQVLDRIIDFQANAINSMISFINRDTYFPNHGLATAGDRESQTGEKRPDRMYFSQLNQPNSVNATDFRDMGELGRPIQGIKGIGNRVFVFTENQIKALFSAGAEQALPLGSGDTKMWNLSQDMTGNIGGLGVLAPDSLVHMELAERDGVGFLSKRGYYFFDGQNFVHISKKVDDLIWRNDISDSYRREMAAYYIRKKRQLVLSVLGWYDLAYVDWSLVANMKFSKGVEDIVWCRSSVLIEHGVELDNYIDNGKFFFVNKPDTLIHTARNVLELDANEGSNNYKDESYTGIVQVARNVMPLLKSKQFDVFDAELLKYDLHISGDSGYQVAFVLFKDGLVSGTTILDPAANGMHQFPIGTQAVLFMFELIDDTAYLVNFEKLDFYFNVHGERRLS